MQQVTRRWRDLQSSSEIRVKSVRRQITCDCAGRAGELSLNKSEIIKELRKAAKIKEEYLLQ